MADLKKKNIYHPQMDPNFVALFFSQWIGLRENLQETMVFTIKYRGFL